MFSRLRLAALIAFCAGAIVAGPAYTSDAELTAAANREGALAVYACEPGLTPSYIDRFKKRYPGIRVTSYQAACLQLYNRHLNERGAGKQVASVFLATDDVFVRMQAESLLTDYRSPEAANFGRYEAPQGQRYQAFRVLVAGPTINKTALGTVPPPADWLDFAKPRNDWEGKILFFDPRTSSSAFMLLAGLHQNFGADGAASVYKGMLQAKAELAASAAAATPKLLSGEKPIQFYTTTSIYSAGIAKGASLQFIVPKSGVLLLPFAVAVVDGAPQPSAARLFVDFMLTEGQEITQDADEYALRRGSRPPKGLPALDAMKALPVDTAAALKQQQQLVKWWQDITGIN